MRIVVGRKSVDRLDCEGSSPSAPIYSRNIFIFACLLRRNVDGLYTKLLKFFNNEKGKLSLS
jgi:hypothetical protein